MIDKDPEISSFSRAQAIEDGVLIDVSVVAAEAGFRVPVALTKAAWAECVAWSKADTDRKKAPQDEDGRLWDVVYMASVAARDNRAASRIDFIVYCVPVEGKGVKALPVALAVTIHAGDDPAPVATISLSDED